ncbi:hypothetical protein [Natronomonas sp.]|uniref:hypothetical protein n=1 Tax=Natronomonas sp. TaxID=2184060 RepID=UPI002FC39FBB
MVETEWPELGGKQLQYGDHTWELTGTVEVQGTGDSVAVRARRADDVRGEEVDLRFGIDEGPGSLNPGNLGEHFDRLERSGNLQYLVVKKEGTVYRYKLRGIDR